MQSTDPTEILITITRDRYGLPILSELKRDRGCKFVTLIKRLQASDRAVRTALDHLILAGLAQKNPGYGHPSRPEYILTPRADRIGIVCLSVWDELKRWDQADVALERWPLPVMFSVHRLNRTYSEIQRACPKISPRALSIALKRLIESGLLNRSITPGSPPATEYHLTPWGNSVVSMLAEL
jgi:DNA-binding HxlR family transcriptional regulator